MISTIILPNTSKILTKHGKYTSVYELKHGEAICYTKKNINAASNVAYVKRACRFDIPVKTVTFASNLWHSPIDLLQNNMIMTSNGLQPARLLCPDQSVIAPNTHIEKQDEERFDSSYEFGYIVGTIMFSGFVHTPDRCVIYFDEKQSLQTFFKYWSKNFKGFNISISKPASVFKMVIEGESYFKLFQKDTLISQSLLIPSPIFARGLVDAYSSNLTHNISKDIYEVFLWAKLQLSDHVHSIKTINETENQNFTALSIAFPTTNDDNLIFVNNCILLCP